MTSRIGSWLMAGLMTVGVAGFAGCEVEVRDPGEMPEVDVEPGRMPDVDVRFPDEDPQPDDTSPDQPQPGQTPEAIMRGNPPTGVGGVSADSCVAEAALGYLAPETCCR